MSTATATTARRCYAGVPKSAAYLYVGVLSLLYLFVLVHTPLILYPGAPHDDALYASLGRYLSEGLWLGPFNEFTLMKGPGYPVFLAVSNWSGMPVSLTQGVFHCLAVTVFVAACHRFSKSWILSGLLFFLLLWQPLFLTVHLRRILREQISNGLVLLLLGLLIIALFAAHDRRRRWFYGVASGLALGWLWLTREEGSWIIPGVALLIAAATYRAYRLRQLPQIIVTVAIIFTTFASTQAAFRARNWWQYGMFVGVDVKETNFLKALGALSSVRSGEVKEFTPVSRATRQHIYRVSPAFASMKAYFDPINEATPSADVPGWVGFTCRLTPQVCGEIGAGWFLWALRDAASQRGHYASAKHASAFYGRLASEINMACARGELDCRPQFIAELPPVSWSDVAAKMFARIPLAFTLITTKYPTVPIYDSIGTEDMLAAMARFLNHPRFNPPQELRARSAFSVNGWFHRAGAEWFSVAARTTEGASEPVNVLRRDSVDLQSLLNDPLAARQRFTLSLRCAGDCTLVFDVGDGIQVEKQIAELRSGLVSFKSGNTSLVLESTTEIPNLAATETRAERTANRIRVAVATNYHLVYLPVLAFGAVAFLFATLLSLRRLAFRICYVLAFVCWTLVLTRVTLLALIDATSFPGLSTLYMTPVYFVAAAAAVLSLAALADLATVSAGHRQRTA